MKLQLLIILLTFFLHVKSIPSHHSIQQYLEKYGYARKSSTDSGKLQSHNSFVEALRKFQQFAGIPETGKMDALTIEKMEQKRCGNVDIEGTAFARRKRYNLRGGRWRSKLLTYSITDYTGDLSRREVDTEIKEAFRWWSDQSGLKFTQVGRNDPADIKIKFAIRNHGDNDPFDGRGQTLAHAYFPNSGGDAHFDDDEYWLLRPSRSGVSLRIVAAHEFGHSLGLSHSDARESLMAPFYNPLSDGLETDDIRAIQRLYGPNEEKPSVFTTTRRPIVRPSVIPPLGTTTTKRTTTTDAPPNGSTCNGRFDAIAQLTNGSTYAFQGNQFYLLNSEGIEKGFPQSIQSVWSIQGKIDAALSHGIFIDLFQGETVHRFFNGNLFRRGPIRDFYKGVPSGIDAAFQWSGNGKLYFVKGDMYWRYNLLTREVDPNYPRPLSVWKGLPPRVDAALQWNGNTYFFSDKSYFRIDDENIKVAELIQQPYPRRIDQWWLGCSEDDQRQNLDLATDATENVGGGSKKLSVSSSTTFLTTFLLLAIVKGLLL